MRIQIGILACVLSLVLSVACDSINLPGAAPSSSSNKNDRQTELLLYHSDVSEKITLDENVRTARLAYYFVTTNEKGERVLETVRKETHTFDAFGNETATVIIDYLIEGKPSVIRYRHKYDDRGNRTEWTIYNAENVRERTYTYTFSKNDEIVEATEYEGVSNRLISRSTHLYDDDGNRVELRIEGADGNLERRYAYKFDKYGNQIEECGYDMKGIPDNRIRARYDRAGSLVEEAYYGPEGNLERKYTYEYDEKGKKREVREYDEVNATLGSIKTYAYGTNDRLIEERTYSPESVLIMRVAFLYDERGNILERAEYQGEKRLAVRFVYSYDERGNRTGGKRYVMESRSGTNATNLQWRSGYDIDYEFAR